MADRPGHSFEDTLRYHDAAFYGFWGDLHVDYGSLGLGVEDNLDSPFTPIDRNDFPILRVFAAPQRAVAEVVDRLVNTGWLAGSDATAQAASAQVLREKAREDFATLPLPLLTIERDDPVPNAQDAGIPKVLRKQCFNEANQAYQTQRWPGAYELTYRVVAWSIKRYTDNFIKEWVLSQLGSVGANEMETFLPVYHKDPWGRINQALSLVSVNDQSQLEGEDDARIIRREYTFTLKMWHFKRPTAPAGVDPSIPGASEGQVPVVQGFNLQEVVCSPDVPLGADVDPSDLGDDPALIAASAVSLNMFSIYVTPDTRIPTAWPTAGNATVRRGGRSPGGNSPHPTLRMSVTDATDEVLVSNRTVALDPDGLALLSLAFEYIADAASELVVAYKAAGEGAAFTETRVFALPAQTTWARGQFFAVIEEPVYSITLRGAGVAAIVDLSDVDLRHVRSPATKTLPSSSTPGAGVTVHAFSGLANDRAHLFVLSFSGAGTGTVDVDGASYPAVSLGASTGYAAVFPPVSGAATITVPDALSVSGIYVQRYLGPWDGTDV